MDATQVKQTVTVDLQAALNIINAFLPLVTALDPALAKDSPQIQLGVTAAQALLPLIQSLPTSGAITPQIQAAQLAKVYSILAGPELSKSEWTVQV